MKVTLCGSIAFLDEMNTLTQQLQSAGHEAKAPNAEFKNEHGEPLSIKEYYVIRKNPDRHHEDWIWNEKGKAIKEHFEKIIWADVILVANYTKHDVEGYIGANTLIEMGLAFHLEKPIYLWNDVPELSYKEEILGMHPIVLNRELTRLS